MRSVRRRRRRSPICLALWPRDKELRPCPRSLRPNGHLITRRDESCLVSFGVVYARLMGSQKVAGGFQPPAAENDALVRACLYSCLLSSSRLSARRRVAPHFSSTA